MLGDAGVTVDLAAGTPLPDGEPLDPVEVGLDDVAAFFYTSGTTGHPKGVPTSHRAFLTSAENLMRCIGIPPGIGSDLRTLISVPLFHVTGCNAQLLVAARAGGTAVILPAFNQAALVAAIGEERINFLVTVPAIYALIVRRPDFAALDVSHVTYVGYGGAPIAPSLVKALQEAFPDGRVFNGYGMTETAGVLTVLPHEDAAEHADSVGYAVPSVDLAVAPAGEDPSLGELLVRGANVTGGYWERPDDNARTIVDGWLHTGDIVRVDDAGRIHIVDRIKDIIIRGGENISSVEVEAALVAAPGVLEAAVLAVPDEVMGEKVGAVLYGDQGPIDVDAVLAHCREQLADFKIPQYVKVSDEPLPRNPSGKLLKTNLRGVVDWGPALR
jgi:acyl-CoA synthetase (AMP-forming)/AMP-acid ligase II